MSGLLKSIEMSAEGVQYLKLQAANDCLGSIVLAHGYGANMNDLAPLASYLDPNGQYDWFFPNAPVEISLGFLGTGRAWFNLDMEILNRRMQEQDYQGFIDWEPQEFSESLRLLSSFCEALLKENRGDKLFIGGFSQGSMMMLHALHALSSLPDGLVLLSSSLVASSKFPESWEQVSDVPIFLSHGRQDPVLPYPLGEYLFSFLQKQAMQVQFLDFDGQHEIPPRVLDSLKNFLKN